jgi:hypothetical protein
MGFFVCKHPAWWILKDQCAIRVSSLWNVSVVYIMLLQNPSVAKFSPKNEHVLVLRVEC